MQFCRTVMDVTFIQGNHQQTSYFLYSSNYSCNISNKICMFRITFTSSKQNGFSFCLIKKICYCFNPNTRQFVHTIRNTRSLYLAHSPFSIIKSETCHVYVICKTRLTIVSIRSRYIQLFSTQSQKKIIVCVQHHILICLLYRSRCV